LGIGDWARSCIPRQFPEPVCHGYPRRCNANSFLLILGKALWAESLIICSVFKLRSGSVQYLEIVLIALLLLLLGRWFASTSSISTRRDPVQHPHRSKARDAFFALPEPAFTMLAWSVLKKITMAVVEWSRRSSGKESVSPFAPSLCLAYTSRPQSCNDVVA
jgi:hypothetical protein